MSEVIIIIINLFLLVFIGGEPQNFSIGPLFRRLGSHGTTDRLGDVDARSLLQNTQRLRSTHRKRMAVIRT